jgi:anthranilate synthase component 1
LTYPDRERFRELSKSSSRVTLVRRFLSDHLTPILLYGQILAWGEDCFLLESGDGPEHATRYSFLGWGSGEPFGVDAQGACFPDPDIHPFDRLRGRLQGISTDSRIGPFPGGAIGYLAYEAASLFESVPISGEVPCPLMQFMEVDRFLVFDHHGRKLSMVVSVETGKGDLDLAYQEAEAVLDGMENLLLEIGPPRPRPDPWFPLVPEPAKVLSPFAPEDFLIGVKQLKKHIRAGDIFQAVLSRRYQLEEENLDLFELYRVMRATNPSPYMFHLRMGDLQVAGTSPESLITVRGGLASVRPIAGTRPRGTTRQEDLTLQQELEADAKEIAEHVMLVDLGRNDLGRVCQPGSVRVTDFKFVERYSHVMHLVSNVEGKLACEKDALDALQAAFPAGTVSGAPKIRAMQLLADLEPEARGVYAGAIVYLGDGGDLDSCIAIRTVVSHRPGSASVQAGAGIVYDSVPQKELEETLHKASAALRAAAGSYRTPGAPE